MSPCTELTHAELRRQPREVLNVRWWPDLEIWIGECRECGSTLSVEEPECPPEQERAA